MVESIDYDALADTYGHTRQARPWVLAALESRIAPLPAGSTVVEIGCGTGNYCIALKAAHPGLIVHGFDRSDRMLAVARSRSPDVVFSRGDADEAFPYPAAFADALYCVDVVHHLTDHARCFAEVRRVARPRGMLMIVTDSEADIRGRTQSVFFPETVEIELRRYPPIPALTERAARAGLRLIARDEAAGLLPIDNALISMLEQKSASSLQLIPDEAHREGMRRVKTAAQRGERWRSRYTVLTFEREPPGREPEESK